MVFYGKKNQNKVKHKKVQKYIYISSKFQPAVNEKGKLREVSSKKMREFPCTSISTSKLPNHPKTW